jgi:hypothetical protein
MTDPSDPEARIVDWFRVDPSSQMRRILIAGPGLLTLGGLVVAVQFATRAPSNLRAMSAAIGLLLVASGAGFTLAAMYRILRDDTYLAIRTDGVIYRAASTGSDADTQETLIGWDDLARARWDGPTGAIVLERVDGEPLVVARRFAGVTGPALATRIERARQRAAMGLPA